MTHEYGLSQLVKVPIRQDHILDLFFTSHPQQVEKIDVLPGLSDHDIVSIQLKCKPILQRQNRREILLFNKANWEAIRSGLEAFYQQVCSIDLNSVDVNVLWSQFCTTLTELTTTHVPVKITRSKCSLPWITTKIRKMIRKRNRLYSMYKSTHSVTLHEQYKSLKHTIQREIRSSHQRYVSSLISTGNEEGQQPYRRNNKKLWTYIKGLRKDNSGIPPLSVNGTVTSNSSQKSEMLSNHFNSVFTTEDLDNFPDKGPSPHPVIENINVCSNGIRNQLNSLDVHKATGPDGISARILKETSDISALILRIIFVSSLEHGIVPSDWKIAHVVPVFKKGDRSNPCNYRPISLTSIVSKVLEHILSSHIMKHLESNGILHSCQHGFRHNRSCESQLISLVHELMQNHDNNIQSDIILTDFAKAFDKVPHNRLLYKLQWYGISGKIHQWINSFLSNRSQKVTVEGSFSTPTLVTSGVPQGTVLGPLLFLTYINDLPDCLSHCTIRLFADDCILYRPIQSEHDSALLQRDIDSLIKWCNTWQMKLNIDKCCSMSILPCKYHHDYHMSNTPLSSVSYCKYLGVTIQSDLKWNKHVQQITRKANNCLSMLQRNIKIASIETKTLAYQSLVRSQLEYAATVWSPWQSYLIQNIEKIQRRAARYVSNNYSPYISVTQLLQSLGWETLERRRTNARLSMMHKMINQQIIIPYNSYLQYSNINFTRESNCYKFIQFNCHKNTFQSSFFPYTVPKWNKLPDNVVNSLSLPQFKLYLLNYVL